MGFKKAVLSAVRSNVPLTCAIFAADGAVAAVRGGSFNHDLHLSGDNVARDARYARDVAVMYTREQGIRGKVAEVGPGGSAAVGLLLADAGADTVDLIDRFSFDHADVRLARVYQHLGVADRWNQVRWFTGNDASAENFFRGHRDYDAIFSCAVMEHLSDPIAALVTMVAALRPSGRMRHQIDFRDHGIFTDGGHHPLTFLTIPRPIYALMSRARGRPNRVLVDQYRAALHGLDVDYEVLVTDLLGGVQLSRPTPIETIEPELIARACAVLGEIRSRLPTAFASIDERDLIVAGAQIDVRRRTLA